MLFALAKELKNIYSLMGNQKMAVMPLLESLASYEETVVRDEAVKSISALASQMSDKEVSDTIYPLVISPKQASLKKKKWSLMNRQSKWLEVRCSHRGSAPCI